MDDIFSDDPGVDELDSVLNEINAENEGENKGDDAGDGEGANDDNPENNQENENTENEDTKAEGGESENKEGEGEGGESQKDDAHSEEIESLKSEVSELEEELGRNEQILNNVEVQFENIRGLIADGLREGGDPLAPLFHMVQLTGGDVNAYVDAVSSMVQGQAMKAITKMEEMGDSGADLHFKEYALNQKSNAYALKSQMDKREQEGASEVKQFNSYLENNGVTRRQYNAARSQLVKAGHENPTNETIIDVAQMNPYYSRVQKAMKDHVDEEGVPQEHLNVLSMEMARLMRRNPNISNERATRIAAETLGFEISEVEDQKTQGDSKKKGKSGKSGTKKEQAPWSDDEGESIWTMKLDDEAS